MAEEDKPAESTALPLEEPVPESTFSEVLQTAEEPSVTPPEAFPSEVLPVPEAVAPSPSSAPAKVSSTPDFRVIIREAKRRKREARLEKLLALVRKKGKITNNDAQKLLGVSDATATRYLRELTSRGVLRRAGVTKAVHYLPI